MSKVERDAAKISNCKKNRAMQKGKNPTSVKIQKIQDSENLFDKSIISDSLIEQETCVSKTHTDRECNVHNTHRDFGLMLNTADRKLKKEREKNKLLRHKLNHLTNKAKPKESYQYLKNIGAEQISSGMEWTSTLSDEVQKRTRLHYEKIKQVTSGIEDEFDEIIREKLNGTFRATVKEEILKFIQRQGSSLTDEEFDENILNTTLMNIKKEHDDEVAEKQDDNLNGGLQSHNFLEDMSLSSVHTSDLSSYEDDISISSEEGDAKRKVSLKFAAEEIERVKKNRLLEETKQRKQKKRSLSNDNGFQSPDSMISPRRERKPNSKYFSNDVVSSFDVDFQHPVCYKSSDHASSMVRKRGRPKKEITMSLLDVDFQSPVGNKEPGASGVGRKRGRPRKYSHD